MSRGALQGNTVAEFAYDANGNITQIADGSGVVQHRYEYDALGQLIREDNRPLNKSYVYAYDNAGNRTSKTIHAFTTGTLGTAQETVNYTYGNANWGDLLTNVGDQIIEYDTIGNPVCIYYEDEDGWQIGYVLTWDGRQLLSIQNFEGYANDRYIFEDSLQEFHYNADGIRIYAASYYETHYYTVDGGRILEEKIIDESNIVYNLIYIYDEQGAPIGIKYCADGGTYSYYFFEKNLQGDIIAIYNASGVQICTYTYDAWGNCSITYPEIVLSMVETLIINTNPFRYRSYFYDVFTGWYMIQGRFYNPETGRFVNANLNVSANGGLFDNNLFLYCTNNPVGGLAVNNVYAPHFGAAWGHNPSGSGYNDLSNCFGYALGVPECIQSDSEIQISARNDVYEMSKWVVDHIISRGYGVREISGPNAPIAPDEYRIAFRVGTTPINSKDVILRYDFHFMVQANTGHWAEQAGAAGPVRVWSNRHTPETIPWDLDAGNGNIRYSYYDSDIIYFAIRKG